MSAQSSAIDGGRGPILVTGAAGFIGANVSGELLRRGCEVVGIDNVNDYYDPELKRFRLSKLQRDKKFSFKEINLAHSQQVSDVFKEFSFPIVIHLGAQAGVRYSIENPGAYVESNLLGFQNVLECCRKHRLGHFVFASSSSVYGNSELESFSESDCTDKPVSLYAATKKSNEVIAYSYSQLYGLPTTGLRFFTVYGPAGRPDMAYFHFTKSIIAGDAIRIFNNGKLRRDFTYIDDIVAGVIRACEKPPCEPDAPYRVLNLGNNQPVELGYFIEVLEQLLEKKAVKEYVSMQPGDVYKTCANINAAFDLFEFEPRTKIEQGLESFVRWYIDYYGH